MSESEFWKELDISLLPDETILYRLEPDRSAIFKSSMVASLILVFCTGPFYFILLPLIWWANSTHAKRHQAFVTNRRVIVTNGLIGYATRSVPIERISDVQIGCAWTERLFDIRTVVVRDMTGEAQGGARIQGLKNVHMVQELILKEVHRVNLQSEDTLGIEDAQTGSSEVIMLLKDIRDTLKQR